MNSLLLIGSFLILVIQLVYGGDGNGDEALKILDLSKCPYQIEPIGCYREVKCDRSFKDEIINGRDMHSKLYTAPSIQWKNYNHWLANFICECVTKLMTKKGGNLEYIGLQYYGECWSDLDKIADDYAKYGEVTTCVNGDYDDYTKKHMKCQVYMGKEKTSFVYKVTKRFNEEDSCPYFTSRGCFKDTSARLQKELKPLPIYAMNERDTTVSNWNGHMINWKKWGTGYLNGLLCRCAVKAKEAGVRFFGIQFYGECWIGDDESKIAKDGEALTCVDDKFKQCPVDNSDKCLPMPCAGKGGTNMIYEVHQGPLGCKVNPCKNGGECIPKGPDAYMCK